MRIDDENKVVWCSEVLLEWYESFRGRENIHLENRIRLISIFGWGNNLQNGYGDIVELTVADLQGDTNSKLPLIKAICDNYEFKLEQPQKYYWRKKNEHLAWFEENNREYLSIGLYGEPILDVLLYSKIFTEPEAFHILQHDFDKFEKVEVE
ncbi:hypothetical protein [Vagococcus fluvialis]|uniref:hypothetical protein n=1 Tax=Vagococcus fluvialis TaxID=2738 RepID=UPI001D0A8939|nr:hypothetical protein [Vagococcus fluvialis]UDM75039.1 hypothetical protein K5K99_05545 [Vagococcus fluvialis]